MPMRGSGASLALSSVIDEKSTSLERVMGGLQRLVQTDEAQNKTSTSPKETSPRQSFDPPQVVSPQNYSSAAPPPSSSPQFRPRESSTHSQHSHVSPHDDGSNEWS